jgi:hypothetical protein
LANKVLRHLNLDQISVRHPPSFKLDPANATWQKVGSSSNSETLADWAITANCGSAAASLVETLEEGNYKHRGSGLVAAGGPRAMVDGQGRSQLELWAYETSDAKLTISEKLEKRYWEGLCCTD